MQQIEYLSSENDYLNFLNYLIENKFEKIFILCDNNTRKYCLPHLKLIILHPKLKIHIIEIKCGEQNKSLQTCKIIWGKLINSKCDKGSILINLGGGVISDLGGFVGAIYKRGLNVINVPTTLLSMIDASIGGKNGIDFKSYKNILGLIKLPNKVYIDSCFLKTLNDREIRNGFAEIIKIALVCDLSFWKTLCLVNNFEIELNILQKSIDLKSNIVSKDLHELGLRKILNFGHTIGHGIEAYWLSNKNSRQISHGEAVIIGIITESFISNYLGFLNNTDFKNITAYLLRNYDLINIPKGGIEKIIEYIYHDKKNINNKIYPILLKGIGNPITDVPIDTSLIEKSLLFYNSLKRIKIYK